MWRRDGASVQLLSLLRAWILALLLLGRPALGASVARTTTACGGGGEFGGGLQARAVSAQYVLVGKVLSFADPAPSSSPTPPAASRSPTVAYVLVESVAKAADAGIQQSAQIFVDGLASSSAASSRGSAAVAAADAGCVTHASPGGIYILFLNASAAGDGRYRTVRAAASYTRSDYTLVRDVTCSGCATPPKAKAKKLDEVVDGTADYKLTCRADSRLLSTIQWYKDGTPVQAGSGAHLSEKKKKDSVTSTLRLKRVRATDAGVYSCFARNALGNSTATTKLTVLPRGSATGSPGQRPVPTIATNLSTVLAGSHYVDCLPVDKDYCLHGGRCQIRPNGHGRHCVCSSQYVGNRCQEKYVAVGTRQVSGDDSTDGVKSHVITALATALGVLLLAVCLYIIYRASRRRARRKERAHIKAESGASGGAVKADGFAPVWEVDGINGKVVARGYMAVPSTHQIRPMATQACGDCLANSYLQPNFIQPSLQASAAWAVPAVCNEASSQWPDSAAGERVLKHGSDEIGNQKGRQRLVATAWSTGGLHYHGVTADASLAGSRDGSKAFARDAPLPRSCRLANQAASVQSSARWTPDADAPPADRRVGRSSSNDTGSLYEEPGAVDTSSASHVTLKQQAICDKQCRLASRDSSYDTVVDGRLQPSKTTFFGDSVVLDALLDQLRASS